MRKEIGSYFTLEDENLSSVKSDLTWVPSGNDFSFTFSGRAAIELAIKDIQSYQKIENVHMPAYCCQSMIQPFEDAGLEIEYYDVYFCENNGLQYEVDMEKECDIFFAMSYFGLEKVAMDDVIAQIHQHTIVIEDVTHRLLSKQNASLHSHYTIASVRKWFGIPSGGIVTKKNGNLLEKPTKSSNTFVIKAIKGMEQKQAYLLGKNIDKSAFFNKLKESDRNFTKVDATYKIDDTSLNTIEKINLLSIKNQRVENASYLYEQLQGLDGIQMLIKQPDWTSGVPLFVPIVVEENRNSLHKYLLDHKVYCPIHWPNSEGRTNITANVISLICDHRYSINDMKLIVQLIKQWLGN